MMAMRAKLTVIALACALLSACGIKGPLHLPAPGTGASGQPVQGADHSKPSQPPAPDEQPGQYTPIQ
ncbi:LPS translocon maturation chaperone LptM [Thauera butanivorans]|uniref:LPS translocon maturation chaperone LptM n=1 Tax=Thauera butanivorans TaxID=86174 RepID=UPI000837ACD6|nr:lipoprotein [Thauera butanivorans]